MNDRGTDPPLLRVEALTKHFDLQKGFFDKLVMKNGRPRLISQTVHAVNGVDLAINQGETLALVGESGCGKSTLAKTIIGLHQPTSGRIWYKDDEISALSGSARLVFQKKIQMIFQDPFSSLNPRKKVMDIVARPLKIHGPAPGPVMKEKVLAMMARVGLDPEYALRYPHQFSGGQRQRIGIARALVCGPELVIADEPISALDVSIQAQILNLLMELQEEFNLTYLFVSHDLSVVRHISTTVAVMYLGHIVETGSTEDIFAAPAHPYTQLLFSAIPTLEDLDFKDSALKEGEVPTPIDLPPGCPFSPRCPHVFEPCRKEKPVLTEISPGRLKACHLI